jgi:uncharacterized membrane protein
MPSGGSAWPRGLDERGTAVVPAGTGESGSRWPASGCDSSMMTPLSWRLGVALGELTRARLASAPIIQPAPPRQVLSTLLVAVWLIAVAAIIAVGVAAAIRWPAAAAALAFRAGYAAGVAWARLRSFGAWLLDGVKRMIE